MSIRTRKLSRSRSRGGGTSDRPLTQRDVDEWLARVLLNVAEVRELAKRADNPRLKLAVEALDGATLSVLKELEGIRGMPDVSDIVARVIVENGNDSSSLRLLGRDLREF
jgi:adenylyl- and sulfurtransferase ThiI